MDERYEGDAEFAEGPNALCFTCGGFRKISEPRIYVIQATVEMQTGMSLSEWRTCPQCEGAGQLSGLRSPS